MLKRVILLLTVILYLVGCSSKTEAVYTLVGKYNSSTTMKVIEGKNEGTLTFDNFKSGWFYKTIDNFTLQFKEELAVTMSEISVIPYVLDKGQYVPMNEKNFTKHKSGKHTLYYITENSGKNITVVEKCSKYGFYYRYKIVKCNNTVAVDLDKMLSAIGKLYETNDYFWTTEIDIGNDFTITSMQAVETIDATSIHTGEKWGIARKGILQKSAGYDIVEGSEYVLKYKKNFDTTKFLVRVK